MVRRLSGERIHRADAIELYAFDRNLVGALAARLERLVAFSLSIAERDLYVSIGTDTLTARSRASRSNAHGPSTQVGWPRRLITAAAPNPLTTSTFVRMSFGSAETSSTIA